VEDGLAELASDAAVELSQLSPLAELLQRATGLDAAGLLAGDAQELQTLLWGLALAAYLFATPGVLLGALDTFLLAPLDALLAPRLKAEDVKLLKRIGDGTFGSVYAGTLGAQSVVAKKHKPGVEGAEELQRAEQYFNARCRRSPVLRRGCAPFLGSYPGVGDAPVLVWSDRGTRTLADLLEDSDPEALERALRLSLGGRTGVARDNRIARQCMRQILTAAKDLHDAGIVHRDVKPTNLVAMQSTLGEPRLRLVDFGAAADLRTGFGFDPKRGLCDPNYVPPEQLVLPEGTPAPPSFAPLAAAGSPFLWFLGRPDLYDAYSCGIILLQLCIPALRRRNTTSPAGTFQRSLAASDYDLRLWRAELTNSVYDFSVLDAGGGLAWDLACRLVRPRDALQRGRSSCAQALLHPWMLLP